MTKPKLLSDAQIRRALPELHGWRFSRGALRCQFKFESFAKALRFVAKVGAMAETADHHPDIDIRYCVVKLALSTHDVGGVSDRDFSLAQAIDRQSEVRNWD
ncbi:MAG: 4a-hydroxytetrahydrobiopterin dehydratase [Vicinamibacteria bacterium]|nr:4a-hydroxytetrahydrobiopterin dehydratase [Vicinamibacteria bacterium]